MKKIVLPVLVSMAIPWCALAKTKAHREKKEQPPATEGKSGSSVSDPAHKDADAPTALITTELGGRDLQFFLQVYELGALQTWLGEQAKQRGEGDRVKALGDALQATQVEENQLLVRLAQRKGLQLSEPKKTTPRQKSVQTKLAKLTGAKFDEAVLEQIVTTTQEETDAYSQAAASTDPDVKRFAEQINSIVKDKLVLASRVAGKPVPEGAPPGENASVPAVATPAPKDGVPARPAPKGGAPASPAPKSATPAASATPGQAAATPAAGK